MTIRWGVSPIAWANDDMPELGADTTLEQLLTDVKEIGFHGIELGNKFPRDAAVLKPIMERFGLDVIGGWYSSNLLIRDADAEIAAMSEVHLEANNRTWDTIAEKGNSLGIYTDPRPPYGCLGLTLRRGV